jgi:hypothetical protein
MDGAQNIDRQTQVAAWVQELCRLLEEQITCVRVGQLSQTEHLGERANVLVAKIALAAGADPPLMVSDRERVKELYAELRLTLKAQQEETRTALRAVRRGKRMVRTYGNHLSPL